ncbi:hypothetical protein J0H58_38240 [bacterium]|mgnify:CR=1 FL=1|nr:hypothetical protein [bacterium]
MAGKAKAARATKGTGVTAAATAEEGAAPPAEGKLSALAAAARVLAEAGTALTCRQLVAVMAVKGYWRSPGGKTPEATLHAAISTEIRKKGAAARFRKAAPGRFAAAGAAGVLPPGTGGRTPAKRKRASGADARPAPAAG